MRLLVCVCVCLGLLPVSGSHAQAPAAALPGGLPLTVDLQRAPVGSWAEYVIRSGTATMTARWALLAREPGGNTLELTLDGPAAESGRLGGKVVTRMVLAPDPVGLGKPFKQLVVQLGERAPVELPLDLPGLPGQKFQNPDPKKLVKRETVTIAGAAFTTGHYRDDLPDSTVDSWLSDRVPPLGVVKIRSTPRPDAEGPGGRPLPVVTMELVAHGRDARPAITRPPVPFQASGPGPPAGPTTGQRR